MIVGRYYYKKGVPFDKQIRDGVAHYRDLVGSCPNLAHVSPKRISESKIIDVGGCSVFVVPDFRMSEDVMWIGVGAAVWNEG